MKFQKKNFLILSLIFLGIFVSSNIIIVFFPVINIPNPNISLEDRIFFDIARDSQNNLYIAGKEKEYMLLLKYDKNGNFLWKKLYGKNLQSFEARALTIDDFGNVYLIGGRIDEVFNVTILKYNDKGYLIWKRTWGGDKDDIAKDVVVDSLGNIYVVGYTLSFAVGGSDIFILKFNSQGDLTWQRFWSTPANEMGKAIAIDDENNIYITGFTDYGVTAAILIKYNSNGLQLWNASWNRPYIDEGLAITVDEKNNILIGGFTELQHLQKADILVVKYNKEGKKLWDKTISLSGYSKCYGITLDRFNNIIICGTTKNSADYYWKPFIAKIDRFGNVVFNNVFNSELYGHFYGIISDDFLNLYVVGRYCQGDDCPMAALFFHLFDNSIILQASNNFILILMGISLIFVIKEYLYIPLKLKLKVKKLKQLREYIVKMKDRVSRLKILEISEATKVKNKDQIIGIIHEMLNDGEIKGRFFTSTNTLVFDRKITIDLDMKKDFKTLLADSVNVEIRNDILKIIQCVLEMSQKYERIEILEIMEDSGVENEDLIIRVIREMINNGDTKADYFSSTKTIVFDQDIIIENIDELINIYQQWDSGRMKDKKI
ncbi:MAG: SBBP repeat-containing protein [Promethearchaeota archaeon]